MTRHHSISILNQLGLSKSEFYVYLAGLNLGTLAIGAGFAFFGFYLLNDLLHEELVVSFQAILPIELPAMEWTPFLLWNAGMFMAYALMSLGFLGVILKVKPRFK